jgi:hypothetical protein
MAKNDQSLAPLVGDRRPGSRELARLIHSRGVGSDETLVTKIPQVDGGICYVYAQSPSAARRAREILRDNRAMVDHLHGCDGIQIHTVVEAGQ